jgi:hypothetical protein
MLVSQTARRSHVDGRMVQRRRRLVPFQRIDQQGVDAASPAEVDLTICTLNLSHVHSLNSSRISIEILGRPTECNSVVGSERHEPRVSLELTAQLSNPSDGVLHLLDLARSQDPDAVDPVPAEPVVRQAQRRLGPDAVAELVAAHELA